MIGKELLLCQRFVAIYFYIYCITDCFSVVLYCFVLRYLLRVHPQNTLSLARHFQSQKKEKNMNKKEWEIRMSFCCCFFFNFDLKIPLSFCSINQLNLCNDPGALIVRISNIIPKFIAHRISFYLFISCFILCFIAHSDR